MLHYTSSTFLCVTFQVVLAYKIQLHYSQFIHVS